MCENQAPLVQTLNSAIHRIYFYPVDNANGFPIRWIVIYPVDSAIQQLNNWGHRTLLKLSVKYNDQCVANGILYTDNG